MSVRVLTTRMVLPGRETSVLKHLKRLQVRGSFRAPGNGTLNVNLSTRAAVDMLLSAHVVIGVDI
jgi:hypothetical protein